MKTKNNPDLISGNVGIKFPSFQETKPEDLISFSTYYLKHIPKLMEYLKSNPYAKLSLQRIEPSGLIIKKEISGAVSNLNIEKGSFDFSSKECFNGGIYEEEIITHMRTDNILGIIPMVPTKKINPYKNSHTELALSYLKTLKKIKELLCSCVEAKHSCTLFYKYNDNNAIEIVKCKIEKVNKSNITISAYHSIVMNNGEMKSSSLLCGIEKIILNISPEKYLYEVLIVFGQEHHISQFDEMET